MGDSIHTVDPSLSCSICNKTFNNRKSQLRHTSYCRRARRRVTTRKKACKNCIRAKTRCDLTSPSCSRCITKSMNCIYELPPSVSNIIQSAAVPPLASDRFPAISFPESVASTEPDVEDKISTPFDQMMSISEPFAIKGTQRKEFSLNRSFISACLKTFPYMILTDQSLPPFIHPNLAFGSHESDRQIQDRKISPPPLQNCAAIVRWYSVKDNENAIFIGNTIRVEVERLMNEQATYSDSDTLATLQALTIYILLRISQDEDDAGLKQGRDDIAMIRAMGTISEKLKFLVQRYDTPSVENIPDWEDWVLVESLRRTLTLLLIVDLLYDLGAYFPVEYCQENSLELISLPCAKSLWEASTKAEWEKQYRTFCDHQRGRKLESYAGLMKDHQVEGAFDHWLSHLDGLGTMLMAAVSLQPPSLEHI